MESSRNRRLRGLTMFVFDFGVKSLEQSVKLGRLVILISLAIPTLNTTFPKSTTKKQCFYSVFVVRAFFSAAVLTDSPTEKQEWSPVRQFWRYIIYWQLLQSTWSRTYWPCLSFGLYQQDREGDSGNWANQYLHINRPGKRMERQLQHALRLRQAWEQIGEWQLPVLSHGLIGIEPDARGHSWQWEGLFSPIG